MKRSAIILAGGSSWRFREYKATVNLRGKPLISHVVERVRRLVDEVLIVVSSEEQGESLRAILGEEPEIIQDESEKLEAGGSPLVGALAGFEKARGDYSLLLPCDTPFISRDVILLLLDLCVNMNAAIPRWPNGYIEPLQAVYKTDASLEAARGALKANRLDMRSMIASMGRVRYISTLVIRELDPDLTTFFNVNTRIDLRRAERILNRRR